jgi:hypothetical protein
MTGKKRGRPPLSDSARAERGRLREIMHLMKATNAILEGMRQNRIEAVRNQRALGGRPADHDREQWLWEVVQDAKRRNKPVRDCLIEHLKRKHPAVSEQKLHRELTNCERQIDRLRKRHRPKSRPTAREENSSDQEGEGTSTGTVDAGITSSGARAPELASSAPPAPVPKAAGRSRN